MVWTNHNLSANFPLDNADNWQESQIRRVLILIFFLVFGHWPIGLTQFCILFLGVKYISFLSKIYFFCVRINCLWTLTRDSILILFNLAAPLLTSLSVSSSDLLFFISYFFKFSNLATPLQTSLLVSPSDDIWICFWLYF